jgi:hypothetical protein
MPFKYHWHMLFDDLVVDDDALSAQVQTAAFLRHRGYTVELEVEMLYGTRRGRIDLVAIREEEVVAIELDRLSPRKKSLTKLGLYPATHRIVLLRGGDQHYWADGVEVLSLRLTAVPGHS